VTATVTGVLEQPDGTGAVGYVKFHLADADGNRVREGYLSDGTIVQKASAKLSSTGTYTISVPGNLDITPSGTRWMRTFGDSAVMLSVPSTGTSAEHTIIADPPDPIPVVEPSNESDFFTLGASSSPITVTSGFVLLPVPTFIVDVPDLPRPHIFLGAINMKHATVASATLWAAISVVGDNAIANSKGVGQATAAAANSTVTVPFIGRVPAHSAGSYQVMVNGPAGDITVIGGTNGISVVEVLAV